MSTISQASRKIASQNASTPKSVVGLVRHNYVSTKFSSECGTGIWRTDVSQLGQVGSPVTGSEAFASPRRKDEASLSGSK